MRISTSLIPLLSLLVSAGLVENAEAAEVTCNLCGDGLEDVLRWPLYVVDPIGTTCAQLSIHIAFSAQCDEDRSRYQNACCGNTEQPAVAQTARVEPGSNIVNSGPYKTCNICKNGNYPTKATVINILYLAASTCTDYYDGGRRGQIPEYLCDPLQFFAFEPCGCDDRGSGGRAPELDDPSPSDPAPNPAPSAVQQRKPSPPDSRPKLSANRGGAGGGQVHPGRRLKGKGSR